MHPAFGPLILRVEPLETVLHDIASGDDADKSVLIIYDRYEVLAAGPVHQLMHAGVDPDRYVIFAACDFHDATGFS